MIEVEGPAFHSNHTDADAAFDDLQNQMHCFRCDLLHKRVIRAHPEFPFANSFGSHWKAASQQE